MLTEGEDFIVELDGRLIGKAGLWRFPEIGFILHPDHWGRGFAREALGFVIDRAFDVHGLPKVDADVDPRNATLAEAASAARLPRDRPQGADLAYRQGMVRQRLS